MKAAGGLLCLSLCFALGCGRFGGKAADGGARDLGAPASAAGHGDDKEHAEGEHREGAHAHGDGGEATEHGEHGDVEATYTPRRSATDEEECDEAAREILTRLRTQRESFQRRGEELAERERAAQAREAAMAAQSQQVEARIAELTRLTALLEERAAAEPRAKERARVVVADDGAAALAARVKNNGPLLQNMPPAKAAALLSEMKDTALAVALLRAMPADQAGRVLAQLKPEVAARLVERQSEGEGKREEAGVEATVEGRAEGRAEGGKVAAREGEGKDGKDAQEGASEKGAAEGEGKVRRRAAAPQRGKTL